MQWPYLSGSPTVVYLSHFYTSSSLLLTLCVSILYTVGIYTSNTCSTTIFYPILIQLKPRIRAERQHNTFGVDQAHLSKAKASSGSTCFTWNRRIAAAAASVCLFVCSECSESQSDGRIWSVEMATNQSDCS